MSATTITMSVAEARRRLGNTSGMSADQVGDLQQVVAKFYAAKPSHQCPACRSMIWSEHAANGNGDAAWACASCHRSADLTAEQWYVQQTSERQAADAHLRATAAAAPKPRDSLAEALELCAKLRKELKRFEEALPAARSTLTAAQLRHERAEAEATAIDAKAAEHLANSYLGGRAAGGPAPSPTATRAALTAATDGLAAARAAKALLDEKLSDQRTKVTTAQAFARRAAIAVLVAERLEDLLSEATESRAGYLEAVGQLGWLLRHSGVPSTDGRPRQLVAGADMPPATWPEARTAGAAQMETAMAALLADPDAVRALAP